MKLNILAVVGLVLIVGAVGFGFFTGFDQSWLIEIVGASTGLALVVSSVVEKQPIGSKWKAILVASGISFGTILAVSGGSTESAILTVVGAVIAILTVVMGVLKMEEN